MFKNFLNKRTASPKVAPGKSEESLASIKKKPYDLKIVFEGFRIGGGLINVNLIKTLLSMNSQGEFVLDSGQYEGVIGASYTCQKFNILGQLYIFRMLITAEQDRFDAMEPMYVRDANAIVYLISKATIDVETTFQRRYPQLIQHCKRIIFLEIISDEKFFTEEERYELLKKYPNFRVLTFSISKPTYQDLFAIFETVVELQSKETLSELYPDYVMSSENVGTLIASPKSTPRKSEASIVPSKIKPYDLKILFEGYGGGHGNFNQGNLMGTLLSMGEEGKFTLDSNHHPSMVGPSFYARKFDVLGQLYKFGIWMTAGQRGFDSLSPMYSRGAHAIIYLIDKGGEIDTFQRRYERLAQDCKRIIFLEIISDENFFTAEERNKLLEKYPNFRVLTFSISKPTYQDLFAIFETVVELQSKETFSELYPNYRINSKNVGVLKHVRKTQQRPTPENKLSTDIYQATLTQMTENLRKQFIEKLGVEYDGILQQYAQFGAHQFEKQYQEQEQRFSHFILTMHQQLQYQTQSHEAAFQLSLKTILQENKITTLDSLTQHISEQIKQKLQQKLGQNFDQSLEDLLNSQQYQSEMQNLQQSILSRIQERQGQMAMEIVHVSHKLKDEHDPLFQQYQQQQQLLKEQQDLQKPDAIKTFYNTIEKVLGARLMSAMSLASDMIQRIGTKTDSAAEVVGNITNIGAGIATSFLPLINLIPVIGNAVSSITGMLAQGVVKAGITAGKDKMQNTKYEAVSSSLIRLEDAGKLAELVARRLTQTFKKHIIERYISVSECETAGENAANIVYGCIKSGELKSLEGKSLEDKVNYLVQKVQEEAQKKTGFFKKTVVFNETVVAQFSKADRQQVQLVTKSVEDLREERELTEKQTQIKLEKIEKENASLRADVFKMKQTFFSPSTSPQLGFSLLKEESWPQALEQLKVEMAGSLGKDTVLTLQRNEKQITFTYFTRGGINPEKVLEKLGETIQEIFSRDIDDWVVENSSLLITAKATQKAIRLEQFLQTNELDWVLQEQQLSTPASNLYQ